MADTAKNAGRFPRITWPELISGRLIRRYQRFPHAVTSRGLKHFGDLERLARRGHRVVMLYFVQRMDAFRFQPSDHIDPAYGRRLRQALEKGLEAIAYDVAITTRQIRLNRRLPCEF